MNLPEHASGVGIWKLDKRDAAAHADLWPLTLAKT
jgi:hypothetical protein